MKDGQKTKTQLIEELDGLRKRITDLEKYEATRNRTEEELRVKDSAIASAISAMAIGDLQGRLTYANPSFLRMLGYEDEKEILGKPLVEFSQMEVTTEDLINDLRVKESWVAERVVKRKDGSAFDVLLLASLVRDDKGEPIRVLASFIDVTERKQTERSLKKREDELEIKANSLEEVNTALKVLLDKREEDKKELQSNVLANIGELVVPYLERLKKSLLAPEQAMLVEILEANLHNIISPVLGKLSSRKLNLTPMEIRVADLVKNGMSNKEIADFLCLSINTILTHRYNIRTKLGLKNQKRNLRSYLLSLEE